MIRRTVKAWALIPRDGNPFEDADWRAFDLYPTRRSAERVGVPGESIARVTVQLMLRKPRR